MNIAFRLVLLFSIIISIFYAQISKSSINFLNPDYSFLGWQHSGRIGYYLSRAGDVNGDGYDDFMIAAYHVSLHGWNSGAVYLFLGDVNKWELDTSVNKADAVFRGAKAFDMVGYHVAGGGDFDGDGLDDLLIGAPGNWERQPETPGKTYIVLGRQKPGWGADCVLEENADLIIIGESNLDQFGYAVGFAGDLNNDGCDDLLVGAPFRNETDEWDGKAYLIMGRQNISEQQQSVAEIAMASFIFSSTHGKLGSAVTGVDDINQDGCRDFMIGAPGIGTSFLLFGKSEFDWGLNYNLENASCRFLPEEVIDDAGWQIKPAGDVNKDGFPDILISGLEVHFEKGKVYVIFGRKNWNNTKFPLSQADASYIGEGGRHQAGVSIDGNLDFNGDGISDFLVGARYFGNSEWNYNEGKAYLIYGKTSGWRKDVDLSEIETVFIGEDTVNCAGWGVSSIGDVDGDYRNDFIISSPFNSQAGNKTGKVYLFRGKYVLNQIAGITYYHANRLPVTDVSLRLNGDLPDDQNSGTGGYYIFNEPQGSSFIVTPEKPVLDDVPNYCITVYDAALTAFKAGELNEYSRMAADVNKDGCIDIDDATAIAEFAVNLPTSGENHIGEWNFSPTERYYSQFELPRLEEDYACILVGDVSGNWQPSQWAPVVRKNNEYYVRGDGTVVEIPVKVTTPLTLFSVQLSLTYDTEVLKYNECLTSEDINCFQLFIGESKSGTKNIGLIGQQNVSANDQLLILCFDRISEKQGTTVVNFEKVQFNDEPPFSMQVDVDLLRQESAVTFEVLRNYPNPFNSRTTIEFYPAESGNVQLTIFNVRGEVVKNFVFEQSVARGQHRVIWDGTDDLGHSVSSGVYISCLRNEGKVQSNKLILLK